MSDAIDRNAFRDFDRSAHDRLADTLVALRTVGKKESSAHLEQLRRAA
jgi:hypothetical protein